MATIVAAAIMGRGEQTIYRILWESDSLAAYETIDVQVDSRGIARLTLNRPEARNAMSQQMIQELRAAARELAADAAVRGIVLTAAGEIFCAGGDLKGM